MSSYGVGSLAETQEEGDAAPAQGFCWVAFPQKETNTHWLVPDAIWGT